MNEGIKKHIFINLPVSDIERSKYFYTRLGFTNYPLFTGVNQTCMAWSDDILVMLQTKKFFNLGNRKTIGETKNQLSATFTLPVESLEKVNEIIEKGLLAGGIEPIAMIDEGFMQIRTLEDLDGHIWSIVHLDTDKFKHQKLISSVHLRKTEKSDLETLFEFTLDAEANYLAAFTSIDYQDKAAYFAKHTKLLNDATVNNQTILLGDVIVGSIAKFEMDGDNEITYWIERKHWGKGIATKALELFLSIESSRPLFARVAFDNLGSQKVLERCGFEKSGSDKGFSNARQSEIEEYIYKLS